MNDKEMAGLLNGIWTEGEGLLTVANRDCPRNSTYLDDIPVSSHYYLHQRICLLDGDDASLCHTGLLGDIGMVHIREVDHISNHWWSHCGCRSESLHTAINSNVTVPSVPSV